MLTQRVRAMGVIYGVSSCQGGKPRLFGEEKIIRQKISVNSRLITEKMQQAVAEITISNRIKRPYHKVLSSKYSDCPL